MATYKINKMRVIRPTEKMAIKHPDRFLTVFGEFHTDKGVQLSITSKVITFEEAKNEAFSIDLEKGILTVSDGERGRKAFTSLSQEDVNAELAALKKAAK